MIADFSGDQYPAMSEHVDPTTCHQECTLDKPQISSLTCGGNWLTATQRVSRSNSQGRWSSGGPGTIDLSRQKA